MAPGLKADKEFVLELCEQTDAIDFIGLIDFSLIFDEDVWVAACARSATSLFGSFGGSSSFQRKLETKMRTFEGYFKGILCGVNAEDSGLQVLNQGSDSGITRNIASYLDFPMGKQLGQLIKAARNLGVNGFHPYGAN